MRQTGKRQLVIHDLQKGLITANEETDILDASMIEKHCIGCFGCWVKTPATCVIRDGFETIGRRIAACERMVVISECIYGGFSPSVKNALDRCISYLLPFFTLREDGQMHHASRYREQIQLSACFYGRNITEGEEATARRLVVRNALNLNAAANSVQFFQTAQEASEGIL